MDEKQTSKDAEVAFLQEVYKGVSMGTDAVNTILGKARDKSFREELTAELDGYENFANQARDQLTALSVAAKEVSAFAKIPSTISINMNTLVDDSTSKLAELMIDGNTMGVVQMKKELSRVEQGAISDDATKLAEDVVSFQEKNIETMKTFL